jgi:hypothetical protein
MIWRISFLLFFNLFYFSHKAQIFSVSPELKEISGLELINDSTFVAINDGGNSAHLFLLNMNGETTKKILISNAKNTDWEDLAADKQYLYIGDIGNNSNKRKDLCIYRVKLSELFHSETIKADVMQISYADQRNFPPPERDRNFDSECLISAYDELWIFTKNNSQPFDGNTRIYRFKFTIDSTQLLSVFSNLNLGKKGYYFDTPTAGDFENGKFYISTYNRWICLELHGNEFIQVKKKKYTEYNQKEALTIKDNAIWVANEYNKILGSQKLKRINIK